MVIMLIWRWKEIPVSKKEEEIYSREFWMFIGSLILILSSFQIFVTTSIPVFNSIAGTSLAPPNDPIEHYNKFQLPIAVVLALLTAVVQYFKYKTTDPKKFMKKALISFVIAVVLAVGLVFLTGMKNPLFILLLFACTFTIVGNTDILLPLVWKNKIKSGAAAISHIGFGLLLIGALVSTSMKEVLSINYAGINYGSGFDEKAKRENIMLVKNRPVLMGDYVVTYRGDSVAEPNTYYVIDYQRYDMKTMEMVESFTLYPFAQINPKMGLIASPDTRHYLSKDIYTHVSSVPDKTADDWKIKHKEYVSYTVSKGDTVKVSNDTKVIIRGLSSVSSEKTMYSNAHVAEMQLDVITPFKTFQATPAFIIKDSAVLRSPYLVEDIGYKFVFANIFPLQDQFELAVYEPVDFVPDYVILKAIKFPYINFLWIGSIIMTIGFILSIYYRVKESFRNQN
jgi:cytochrome c-type biogenesis protein CcmF